MTIRLHGSRADITAALDLLAAVLTIDTVSRPHRDRPPSSDYRVYLSATLPPRTEQPG